MEPGSDPTVLPNAVLNRLQEVNGTRKVEICVLCDTDVAAQVAPSLISGKTHIAEVSSISRNGPIMTLFCLERQAVLGGTSQIVKVHVLPNQLLSWEALSVPPEFSASRAVRNTFRTRLLPPGSTIDVLASSSPTDRKSFTLSLTSHPHLFLSLARALPSARATYKCICPYRYLVVVDYEATCDYAPLPVVERWEAEIIEVPWVVLDTSTLKVVHEQRILVHPASLECVTPYTTGLTGISPIEIARTGVSSLSAALELFHASITSFQAKGPTCLVTDGVWDIQAQLRSECERKDLPFWYANDYYHCYFDLKSDFLRVFSYLPDEVRPSLKEMLDSLGLDIVGRHHSGIDDCRSICHIVETLLLLGHPFNQPKVITEDYNVGDDADFAQFPSRAPKSSWRCAACSLWNNPYRKTCRICAAPQPYRVCWCGSCGCAWELPSSHPLFRSPSATQSTCLSCSHNANRVMDPNTESDLYPPTWLLDFQRAMLLRERLWGSQFVLGREATGCWASTAQTTVVSTSGTVLSANNNQPHNTATTNTNTSTTNNKKLSSAAAASSTTLLTVHGSETVYQQLSAEKSSPSSDSTNSSASRSNRHSKNNSNNSNTPNNDNNSNSSSTNSSSSQSSATVKSSTTIISTTDSTSDTSSGSTTTSFSATAAFSAATMSASATGISSVSSSVSATFAQTSITPPVTASSVLSSTASAFTTTAATAFNAVAREHFSFASVSATSATEATLAAAVPTVALQTPAAALAAAAAASAVLGGVFQAGAAADSTLLDPFMAGQHPAQHHMPSPSSYMSRYLLDSSFGNLSASGLTVFYDPNTADHQAASPGELSAANSGSSNNLLLLAANSNYHYNSPHISSLHTALAAAAAAAAASTSATGASNRDSADSVASSQSLPHGSQSVRPLTPQQHRAPGLVRLSLVDQALLNDASSSSQPTLATTVGASIGASGESDARSASSDGPAASADAAPCGSAPGASALPDSGAATSKLSANSSVFTPSTASAASLDGGFTALRDGSAPCNN